MDHDTIINMLISIGIYLEDREESPLAARDLRRLIPELKRLWLIEEEFEKCSKMLYEYQHEWSK